MTLRPLLRPAALFSHVVVLTVVGLLVGLGQWQIERLGQVRTSNELLAARSQAEPIDLSANSELVGRDASAFEFRRVTATGVFLPDEEVLQRNRVQRGFQGFDVLTPFALGDGTTLLVRRGWVPATMDTPPVTDAPPPAGVVRIEGVLEASVAQPRFGARDTDEGILLRVFHPDTARLDRQVSGSLLPFILRMDSLPGTDATTLPVPPEAPGLDEGSHLSYAVQWNVFALLALIAYSMWWRKRLTRSDGTGDARPPTQYPDGTRTAPHTR
jgi:surfeit locus 1 family protein